MRHYKVILRPEAMSSVNEVVDFIKSIHTEESAQKYRMSILFELDSNMTRRKSGNPLEEAYKQEVVPVTY